jgi:murein L,D-transpeptidase YafK
VKKIILVISVSLLVYYFLPYQPLPTNIVIEKLVVSKSGRLLEIISQGKVVKKYSISLGGSPVGPKERDGDEKTPEGEYYINDKMGLGISGFHKNLGISYPQKNDILNAKNKGFKPGGAIKIHGLKNGLGFIGRFQRWCDWTDGCIALSNEEIDDLFVHVKIGTPILILP